MVYMFLGKPVTIKTLHARLQTKQLYNGSPSSVIRLIKRVLRAIFCQVPLTCRPIFKRMNVLTFPRILIFDTASFAKSYGEQFFSLSLFYNNAANNSRDILICSHHLLLSYKKSPLYLCSTVINNSPKRYNLLKNLEVTYKQSN